MRLTLLNSAENWIVNQKTEKKWNKIFQKTYGPKLEEGVWRRKQQRLGSWKYSGGQREQTKMGWAHAEKRIENNQINESLPGGIRYIERLKMVKRPGL